VREFGRRVAGVLVAWNIRMRPDEAHPWFTRHDQREFQRAGELIAQALDRRRFSRDEQQVLFLGTLQTNLLHLVGNEVSRVTIGLRQLVNKPEVVSPSQQAELIQQCDVSWMKWNV
jgi:hypothetical protein